MTNNNAQGDNDDDIAQEVMQLHLFLPKELGPDGLTHYFYQNFWCPSPFLPSVISLQKHFQSLDTDVLLVSKPKCGTTWLKAMTFAILNRQIYPTNNLDPSNPHILLTHNPHQLVPFLEIPKEFANYFHDDNLKLRLVSTHLPYNALPESVKKSGCRIVYICRNILDAAVSLWFFLRQGEGFPDEEEPPLAKLEEFLDKICRGVEACGPGWDHVLGYWQESLERPKKVLFMKYEDLKSDNKSEVKRLAEFLGCPFSADEEESGVVEGISKLCSIGNLKEQEVNKKGQWSVFVKNNFYFRRGVVGDWKNYISPSMAERLQMVMEEKLQGSGLSMEVNLQ